MLLGACREESRGTESSLEERIKAERGGNLGQREKERGLLRLEDKRQRSDTRKIEGKEKRGVVVRGKKKTGKSKKKRNRNALKLPG